MASGRWQQAKRLDKANQKELALQEYLLALRNFDQAYKCVCAHARQHVCDVQAPQL